MIRMVYGRHVVSLLFLLAEFFALHFIFISILSNESNEERMIL